MAGMFEKLLKSITEALADDDPVDTLDTPQDFADLKECENLANITDEEAIKTGHVDPTDGRMNKVFTEEEIQTTNRSILVQQQQGHNPVTMKKYTTDALKYDVSE